MWTHGEQKAVQVSMFPTGGSFFLQIFLLHVATSGDTELNLISLPFLKCHHNSVTIADEVFNTLWAFSEESSILF
jgi:hypothetical protein